MWFSKNGKKWVAIRIFGKANHDPYLRLIYLKQLVSIRLNSIEMCKEKSLDGPFDSQLSSI